MKYETPQQDIDTGSQTKGAIDTTANLLMTCHAKCENCKHWGRTGGWGYCSELGKNKAIDGGGKLQTAPEFHCDDWLEK